MRTIILAALIGFVPVVVQGQQPIVIPVPVSCEGWLEIHDQSGKLATDIRAWIIHEVRKQAHDSGVRNNPNVPCADLDCIPDAKILAEVDDWCGRYPAQLLGNAVFNASFILTALKAHDEMERENKENSN